MTIPWKRTIFLCQVVCCQLSRRHRTIIELYHVLYATTLFMTTGSLSITGDNDLLYFL